MTTERDRLVSAMQGTATEAPKAIVTKKWGTVYIRNPTVAEVEADMEAAKDGDASGKHGIARGAARIICDETGKRLFDPKDQGDVDLLASQPWSLLRQITSAFEESDAEGN